MLLTNGAAKKVRSALEAGHTRSAAAAAASMPRGHLRALIEACDETRAAVEQWEATGLAVVASAILQQARDGNWRAAAWWLSRRAPLDYPEPTQRAQVEQSGSVSVDASERLAGILGRLAGGGAGAEDPEQ